MYLRFRQSNITPPRRDGTFEALYKKIHGKLPDQVRKSNKSSFKLQIYLVRSQRINGNPRQVYIGTLANARIYIDEKNLIKVADDFWKQIRDNLTKFNISSENQILLLERIERFLEAI